MSNSIFDNRINKILLLFIQLHFIERMILRDILNMTSTNNEMYRILYTHFCRKELLILIITQMKPAKFLQCLQ